MSKKTRIASGADIFGSWLLLATADVGLTWLKDAPPEVRNPILSSSFLLSLAVLIASGWLSPKLPNRGSTLGTGIGLGVAEILIHSSNQPGAGIVFGAVSLGAFGPDIVRNFFSSSSS